MIYCLLIPFCVQFLAIFFDEFYFHRKRGLPAWEKIGHPLDTLSVFFALLYLCIFPCNSFHIKIYATLSIISMLMITKDEFIHKDICPKSEMWLHAVLFINHPLLLLSAGFMWASLNDLFLFESLKQLTYFHDKMAFFLKLQTILTLIFCAHQFIYWNFLYKPTSPQSL